MKSKPAAVPHAFRPKDLVGGHVVLDFVNTVNGRDRDPSDWLDAYPRLLEWAALTGAFPRGTLSAVERLARADRAGARRALEAARRLREALWEILHARARRKPPPAAALGEIERFWKRAAAAATLERSPEGFGPVLRAGRAGLDLPAFEIVLRALSLLAALPDRRLRVCDGHPCGWLFLDASKAGRRRWCDMATCGNLAKARRHSARKKKPRSRRRAASPPAV